MIKFLVGENQIQNSFLKQSKNKNLKVKIGVMSCLCALGNTLQSELDQHFKLILPVIQATVMDAQNFDPLLDSLRILRTLFKYSPPGPAYNFLKETNAIQEILLSALSHEYSRVVGTGLSVTGSFVNTLLKADGSFNTQYKNIIPQLYDAVLSKLNKVDMD